MGDRNRPSWRWWLWCAALDLWFRFGWRWALDLMGWATLPAWVGAEGVLDPTDHGEEPF